MSTDEEMEREMAQAAARQGAQPTEEEMRAAYEAELARITSTDMILQTAASLLNIGGLRLGLVPDAKVERDLEQVRDAIDGVRSLLPILERGRVGSPDLPQLRPLRDALSQLQMAYTREVQAEAQPAPADPAPAAAESAVAPGGGQPAGSPPKQSPPTKPEDGSSGPGPAESSGRLWVPGR